MPGRDRRYHEDDVRNRSAADFKAWHRTLRGRCYLYDVDGIECRLGPDGTLGPSLLWEFTSVESAAQLSDPKYLELILDNRRKNGELPVLQALADRIGVPFVFIVADRSLEHYCLVHPKTQRTRLLSRAELAAWLESLAVPRAAA
jgi:hypothetical protein